MSEVETTLLFIGSILAVWGAGWIAHRLPARESDKQLLSGLLPFIAAAIMCGITAGLGAQWIGWALFIYWLGYVLGAPQRGQ